MVLILIGVLTEKKFSTSLFLIFTWNLSERRNVTWIKWNYEKLENINELQKKFHWGIVKGAWNEIHWHDEFCFLNEIKVTEKFNCLFEINLNIEDF